MCGRFTLRASPRAVAEQFSLLEPPPLVPRFNIAPSQPVAIVRLEPDSAQPRRQCVPVRWGLIPSWAKDPAIGNRMINARAETAADKPAFRAAMRRRRCLIPADGFYEWQHTGSRRQPFFIRLRDDRLFAFAGLWEAWEGPEHSAVESCTILTTAANDLVRPIHDRMPVILEGADYNRWLDPAIDHSETLRPLLGPLRSNALETYPVGVHVNRPGNEGPQCSAPAEEESGE
jgi:putative SOS response-associated peptidase YedK